MTINIFFSYPKKCYADTVDRGISRFRVQDLVNGNHDQVPTWLKTAVNEPRVRVLCGLRIARFVERCHVRPTRRDATLVSAYIRWRILWRRQFCTLPSIGARNDPARLNCSRPRDSNCRPNNFTNRYVLHTHTEMYVYHPADGVYSRYHHWH